MQTLLNGRVTLGAHRSAQTPLRAATLPLVRRVTTTVPSAPTSRKVQTHYSGTDHATDNLEDLMFCYQCEQTKNNVGCTKIGVCGKSTDVANIQDLLVYQLKVGTGTFDETKCLLRRFHRRCRERVRPACACLPMVSTAASPQAVAEALDQHVPYQLQCSHE